MTTDTVTIEIAKLFESQGYYNDALETYRALENENPDIQVQAGINRMEMKLAMEPGKGLENRIEKLLETWLDLIILQHRVDSLKQIESLLI